MHIDAGFILPISVMPRHCETGSGTESRRESMNRLLHKEANTAYPLSVTSIQCIASCIKGEIHDTLIQPSLGNIQNVFWGVEDSSGFMKFIRSATNIDMGNTKCSKRSHSADYVPPTDSGHA